MINKVEIVNEVLEFLVNNKNAENKFVNYGAIIKNIKEKYFEKTDEHVISKRELIQIIIEMQIKDLEKVEAIFNAFNYPFDYKNGLTTEHDIALKLFVEKDVYDGSMPNDFVNENFLDDYEYCDDEIQNNHCKLDLIIKKIVDSNFSNNNFNSYKADNCENFLYSLISSTMTPSEFDIKESCEKELEELRRYFGEYEAQFIDREKNSENSNKKNRTAIEMDDFIKIVIMTFVKNYYSSDTKSFRVVIDDMNKNILSLAYMDSLYYRVPFSYDRFNQLFTFLFFNKNIEERKTFFFNLFNKIINNVLFVEHSNYEFSISSLEDEEVNNRLKAIYNKAKKDLVKE